MHRQMTVALLAGVVGAARTHTRRFATRETCLAATVATSLRETGWAGVGGAHMTDDPGQYRVRKGALVRGVLERAEKRRLA